MPHNGAPFFLQYQALWFYAAQSRNTMQSHYHNMKTIQQEIDEYQFYKWYIRYGQIQNTQDKMDKPAASVNTKTKKRKSTAKKTVKTKKQ